MWINRAETDIQQYNAMQIRCKYKHKETNGGNLHFVNFKDTFRLQENCTMLIKFQIYMRLDPD